MDNVRYIEREVRYTLVDDCEKEHTYSLFSGGCNGGREILSVVTPGDCTLDIPMSELPYLISALQLFEKDNLKMGGHGRA